MPPKIRKAVKDDEEDDAQEPMVYIPEAVLNKRYIQVGPEDEEVMVPQYLMKWQVGFFLSIYWLKNYPKELATWEPSDKDTCVEFIKEYEKNSLEMKKTNPNIKFGLIPKEKHPAQIIGSKKIKGKHYWLLEYHNGSVQVMHRAEVRKRYPEITLSYYENYLQELDDKEHVNEELERAKSIAQVRSMLTRSIHVPKQTRKKLSYKL